METQILQKGEVAVDVAFKAGKVVLSSKYDGKGADVTLSLELESDYFLDKLAAAIPGQVDDAVIALIKGALAKV